MTLSDYLRPHQLSLLADLEKLKDYKSLDPPPTLRLLNCPRL